MNPSRWHRQKNLTAPGGKDGPAGVTRSLSTQNHCSSILFKAQLVQCGTWTHSTITRLVRLTARSISSVHLQMSSPLKNMSPLKFTSHPCQGLLRLERGRGEGIGSGIGRMKQCNQRRNPTGKLASLGGESGCIVGLPSNCRHEHMA